MVSLALDKPCNLEDTYLLEGSLLFPSTTISYLQNFSNDLIFVISFTVDTKVTSEEAKRPKAEGLSENISREVFLWIWQYTYDVSLPAIVCYVRCGHATHNTSSMEIFHTFVFRFPS